MCKNYRKYLFKLKDEFHTSRKPVSKIVAFERSDFGIKDSGIDMSSVNTRNNLPLSDIKELYIPLLIRDLKKRKIIRKEKHSIVDYYWRAAQVQFWVSPDL